MGRKPKLEKNIKLKIIEQYIKREKTIPQLVKDYNCGKSTIKTWIRYYKVYGAEFFDKDTKNKKYTEAFKKKVVREYIRGNGSYTDLAVKYSISSSGIVFNWVMKYNNSIKRKSHVPKGDVYTMKARKTTYEERVEIVHDCNSNGLDYKKTAEKFNVPYSLVYQWTNKYLKNGEQSLQYQKKGPNKAKKQLNLSEYEKLKQENERLRFEVEVLKKKQYFEEMLYSVKSDKKKNT